MFETHYGTDLVKNLFATLEGKKVLFVTQENLYKKYNALIPPEYLLILIDNMEESYLEDLNKTDEHFEVVIGFGGGMSIDAAKYFAWKRELDCYLVPTAISVDACYSYPIALRRNSVVCYDGEVLAKGIYVDYSIIRSAPAKLNLSGVGDVLSCYTALFDWTLLSKAGAGAAVDKYLYDTASEILNTLFESTDEIAAISDKGIRLIMDAYRWVGIQGYKNRFCHFEEGSEHFLAYTIESICGKHLLHGQLVCMCVYIMSKFQKEGRQTKVKEFTDKIGLSIKPEDIGLSRDEIRNALSIVNDYVVTNKLSYSVLNEIKVTQSFVEDVMKELI